MDDVSAGNCAKAGASKEEKEEGEDRARMEWKSVLSETSRFQFASASIRDITRGLE